MASNSEQPADNQDVAVLEVAPVTVDDPAVTLPSAVSLPPNVLNPLYGFLQDLRDEILQKNRAEIERANEKLFGDLKAVIVQLVAQVVAQATASQRVSRGTKRPLPRPTRIIADISKLVEDKTRFISPLLRSLILLVVACFTSKHSPLRHWLKESAYRSLSAYEGILPHVSGFSTIWFSKFSSDTNERFQTDIGQIWTCAVRTAMVSTIMAMREEYRPVKSPGGQENEVVTAGSSHRVPISSAQATLSPKLSEDPPKWLTDLTDCVDGGLHPGANLTAMVHKTIGEEEAVRVSQMSTVGDGDSELSGSGSGSRRKRQKTAKSAEEPISDREIVIKRLYSSIRSYLGGTRTHCRLVLVSELLFLTKKINSLGGEEAAAAEGYRVVFMEEASAAEVSPDAEPIGEKSVWNIANARVSGGTEQGRIERNDVEFRKLRASFPSLSLRLEYRRRITYAMRDRPEEFTDDFRKENLYWDFSETISLHETAKKLLMEFVRMKGADELLQISSYSLKAIHIIALALRGLVKQQLKRDMTEVEASALGGCISTKLSKDSQFVSPLMGMVGHDGDKEMKTKQEHECDKKFTMSWPLYKAAKRDWIQKQRTLEGATTQPLSLSSNSPVSFAGVTSTTFLPCDDKWTYCADDAEDEEENSGSQ